MTKLLQTLTLAGFTCLLLGTDARAQTPSGDKSKLGEFDEIVIKHKSDKDGKVTVEIKAGDILIDGKNLNQFSHPDISVFRRRITPIDGNRLGFTDNMPEGGLELFNGNEDEIVTPNKAVLGVITEKKTATGVTVKTVAKGSPAEKAGLKTGDIITQIDNTLVNEPRELYETIGEYKPGDKVTVTYTRNKKLSKAAIKLEERKAGDNNGRLRVYPPGNSDRFFNLPVPPGGRPGFGDHWFSRPEKENELKLGLQVQDTEKNDGALVLDITTDSPAAKAGFQQQDVITELAEKPVKSAADVAELYRSYRDKGSITAKVIRNGQSQTLQIKISKKLNKIDL
ncbi:PDZ domain-containing protein [Chitinophaga nivalis]|uniref:PDZ domain-containing protein n=1 Tax=Chitinophaga nivalis TaxID=2991709 RepID=A0ABT3IUF6_9BACT|nr:PDZ domain-containing protein [Chitinophaga nivalis]MCW3462726.1 PDZ domain-containing protein [Chitinophaga nivalis]MCW3487583.1 PDZ domain-containing protein [Chitinophaga nivalis]